MQHPNLLVLSLQNLSGIMWVGSYEPHPPASPGTKYSPLRVLLWQIRHSWCFKPQSTALLLSLHDQDAPFFSWRKYQMSWHSPFFFSSHHFKEGPSVVRNYYQLNVLEACQCLNSVWQTLCLKDLCSATQFETFWHFTPIPSPYSNLSCITAQLTRALRLIF